MKMMLVVVLFVGMFFQSSQAAPLPPIPPETVGVLVEKGIATYKELIVNLQSGVKNLMIVEELTNVAKYVTNLNFELGKQQKEALKVILEVHQESEKALDSAKLVVDKLKNLCDDMIFILEDGSTDEDIKFAIKTFVEEGQLMEKHVKEAIDRLSDTASKASQVDAEMYKLKTWVDKKKHETIIEKKRQKAKARKKAYGGAAACAASGILAWLVCPITYAVAASVTEGKSINEIEVLFRGAGRNMERMRNEIKLIGDKTKDIVSKVSENKESMISIRSKLDKTNRGGRMVVKRFKQSYLARFKKSLYDLYEKCKKYLESQK